VLAFTEESFNFVVGSQDKVCVHVLGLVLSAIVVIALRELREQFKSAAFGLVVSVRTSLFDGPGWPNWGHVGLGGPA
jgi:hypothetical protein